MNIYLDVETAVRELDSKILLGVIAASRGHEIILHKTEILRGMNSGILSPGVFHNKSLTPSKDRIAISQALLTKVLLLLQLMKKEVWLIMVTNLLHIVFKHIGRTSIGYFYLGTRRYRNFKKVYSKHSSKIFMTGSPRADYGKPFSDYWNTPNGAPNRNFLLVSSNFGLANNPSIFTNV